MIAQDETKSFLTFSFLLKRVGSVRPRYWRLLFVEADLIMRNWDFWEKEHFGGGIRSAFDWLLVSHNAGQIA